MFKYLFYLLICSVISISGHEKWISGFDLRDSCAFISKVTPDEICEYARNEIICEEFKGRIDYNSIVFCSIVNYSQSFHLAVFFLMGLIIIYGLCLLSVLYIALTPNLLTLAKVSQLAQQNSSIILTLIDWACSFINHIQHISAHYDTEILLNAMLTAAYTGRTVTTGLLILFSRNIEFYPPYCSRDKVFLIVLWLIIIFYYNPQTGEVSLLIGIILIVYSSPYFIVTIIHDKMVQKKFISSNRDKIINWKVELGSNFEITTETSANTKKEIEKYYALWENLKPTYIIPLFKEYKQNRPTKYMFLVTFLQKLDPRRKEQYANCENWERKLIKMSMPFYTFIILVVPVVDSRLPNKGWNKILICINLFLFPFLLAAYLPFKYWHYGIIPSTVLILFIMIWTDSNKLPQYHSFFVFIGIINSAIMSSFFQSEIERIIIILGLISGNSNGFTGICIGFVDSVDDVFIALLLAAWGSEKSAYSYAITNPILNLYFKWGYIIIRKCYLEGATITITRIGITGYVTLIFFAIESFFANLLLFSSGIKFRMSLGWFSLISFLIYLIFIMLIIYEIIHSFGTDHYPKDIASSLNDWA